jgi:DNA-binding transcriptional LysR family regulator
MVAVMAPDHPVLAANGGRLREDHLTNTRQIVVAGRDLATSDPRFVFARHVWRSDNALAALSLITAGLGWGWLPRNFARPHVAAGALVEIPFENLSNGLDLWVDVVWSRERPLGLGAQHFVNLIAKGRAAAGECSPKVSGETAGPTN